MGKISRLRLQVAPVPRDWLSEGVRLEELDLLCRGLGAPRELSGDASKGPEDKSTVPQERENA